MLHPVEVVLVVHHVEVRVHEGLARRLLVQGLPQGGPGIALRGLLRDLLEAPLDPPEADLLDGRVDPVVRLELPDVGDAPLAAGLGQRVVDKVELVGAAKDLNRKEMGK